MIHGKHIVLETAENVYEPAEDSFLLAENLDLSGGETFLDVGTGCGIIALTAAAKASRVVGVDVNPSAVELAQKNAEKNNIRNTKFLESDLFSSVSGKFDVISFNPPYLPVADEGDLAKSWSGGRQGMAVSEKFLNQVRGYLNPAGRFLILLSSLNNPQKAAGKHSLAPVAEVKVPFEMLFVYEGQ